MKKIKLIGTLILALVIGFSSCGKTKKTETAATAETLNVRIQQVSEREVEQIYEITATVQPDIKNNIAPSTPGRIRNILVKVGDRVAKGQKIVQMDVANLSNSETQIENLKRMYNRSKELFNVGGASQQDLDNVKLQLDVAETNLRNLTENTFLLSPISGIVTAKNYDNGDMYSAQLPILTVMQINPVKLIINVSESYYSQIKLGMPIGVKFDVFENQSFQGKVSLIYPIIDERTRTFAVEIKLSNNNNKILPGMFARVKMELGKAKHVVAPDKAIVKQAGSGAKFIYVYADGKVQFKQVEIGRRVDSDYEILSGLAAGDQVVIAGQTKLVDGAEVKVIK